MQYKLHASLLVSTVALTLFSTSAFATNGYASHGFGLAQKAMGGAAVAGSENLFNGATNPAAFANSSDGWTIGLDIFSPDRGASHGGRPSTGGPDTGIAAESFSGNEDSVFFIPEGGYQKRINAEHTFGLAVYGNGGMNASYNQPIFGPRFDAMGQPLNPDPNTGVPLTAGANTRINLSQLFIAPSWAMNLGPNHSIGVSLNLAYQAIEIEGVGGFAPFSSDPSKLSDNDVDSSTGAGISIGWQGQLTPALAAGITYRTVTEMSEFDDYAGLFAEQGDFDIPSMITAGLSYKASPSLTLAVDLAQINYTDTASISNVNNTAALQAQFIQCQGLPQVDQPACFQNVQGPKLGDTQGAGFGWEDQTIIKLGIKYKYSNSLSFMAGWNHGDAPITEDETAFNLLAPATVEDHLTLGIDWSINAKSKLIVSYMHAFENEIKGSNSFVDQGLPTQRPANPGAFIPIGPNPATDGAATDLIMEQNSIGIAYSFNF